MIDLSKVRAIGKEITSSTLHSYAEKVCGKSPYPGPIRKYAIVSTPRVGSTLLADFLYATGCLGWPLEWFNARYVEEFVKINGPMKGDDYVEMIVRRTASSNGVCGINFHVYQYLDWKKRGLDLLSLGFSKIYWLERNDKIAQAYSYAKALKSDLWAKEAEIAAGYRDGVPIVMEPDEVASALAMICKDTALKNAFPVDRAYIFETLTTGGLPAAVAEILSDFGEPPISVQSPMARQSTDFDSEGREAMRRYFSHGAPAETSLL